MMDVETKREEADKEFEAKREELKRADEEKTRKNKARREKQRARKDKAKTKGNDRSEHGWTKGEQRSKGDIAEGQNGEHNGVNGKVKVEAKEVINGTAPPAYRDLPGHKGASKANSEGREVKDVENIGIVIHDDG